MEPTPQDQEQIKAKLRAAVESHIRSATMSHLRDGQAVQQYVDHQTDSLVDAILRSFKVEKRP
jgi:hypothetical protein